MAGFAIILVDEYQDISEEHYRLVLALAGRSAGEDDKLTILAGGRRSTRTSTPSAKTSNRYIRRFQQDYGVGNFRLSVPSTTAAPGISSMPPTA